TPAFMAPEQARGRLREIDGRTDVWAVGATMFSLLSARYVHEAETATEVVVLAATQPPRPLAEVAPEVHPALCAVIDRALAFDRPKRWPDAESMARALLDACATAFGRSFSELDPIAGAPSPREFDDVHSQPTQAPPDRLARENARPDVAFAPTEILRGA